MVSIFDGHGGSHAANFAWQHMSECIVSRLDQSDYHKGFINIKRIYGY